MAAFDLAHPPTQLMAFVTERHLATLTTLRPDGTPHVVPVGFTYEASERLLRIITFAGSRKVRNVAARPGGRAVVCQVDGGRWLSFEGRAEVTADADRTAEAVRRYAGRYRPPADRPDRVTIEISVERVLGRV